MDADRQRRGRDPASQDVEPAVEAFPVLADATRVRLILTLREAERPVDEPAGLVGRSPGAVVRHPAELRLSRIVAARQEGARVLCQLGDEHAGRPVTDAIFQIEHSLGGVPRPHHAQPEDIS